ILAMHALQYYQVLRAGGLQHGPIFRGVTHVWRRPGEVMSHITIPEGVADDMSGYQVHPALMDAFLQGITPFLPEENEDTYVPVVVKRVKFYQRQFPGGKLWRYVIVRHEAYVECRSLEREVSMLD